MPHPTPTLACRTISGCAYHFKLTTPRPHPQAGPPPALHVPARAAAVAGRAAGAVPQAQLQAPAFAGAGDAGAAALQPASWRACESCSAGGLAGLLAADALGCEGGAPFAKAPAALLNIVIIHRACRSRRCGCAPVRVLQVIRAGEAQLRVHRVRAQHAQEGRDLLQGASRGGSGDWPGSTQHLHRKAACNAAGCSALGPSVGAAPACAGLLLLKRTAS